MDATTQWVPADDLHAMDLAEHLPANHPAHALSDDFWMLATLEVPADSRPEPGHYHDHYRLTVGPHVVTLWHEVDGGGGSYGLGAVHYWHVQAEAPR